MVRSSMILARRWKRFIALLIDGVILLVINLPIMYGTGILRQGYKMTLGQHAAYFVVGLLIYLAVNGYLLVKQGQTVGKKLVGVRIVDSSSERLVSFGRVFGIRYFLPALIIQIPIVGTLFSLVDSLFIFRKDKRCIHDLMAGTKVVDE